MVNQEIIYDRLKEIQDNLTILEDLKSIPFIKFRDDPKIFKLAERCLEISIQCILDICHHIIVENNLSRPKDNKETILILGQKDILPLEFANRILPMAGLRNILVHDYLKINVERLYGHLQNLQDFREFQKYILKALENSKI